MGHYGGNEHIYYFKEYYNMLKEAGFTRIEFHWANRQIDPRKTLAIDLSRNTNGSHQYSVLRCLVKYMIHSFIKRLCSNAFLNRFFVRPLLRISLLQVAADSNAGNFNKRAFREIRDLDRLARRRRLRVETRCVFFVHFMKISF